MKFLDATQVHSRHSEAGFTLVELMIVVAIIGILAAIAVPNYQRYQAKARQSEAKIALAGIHTAESSFAVENNSYTLCLKAIGVGTAGSASKRYYSIGVAEGTPPTGATPGCGPTGGSSCRHVSWRFDGTAYSPEGTACGDGDQLIAANTVIKSTAVRVQSVDPLAPGNNVAAFPAGLQLSKDAFTAGAVGNVTNSVVYDKWTINQDKALNNVTPGLD